MRKLPDGVEKIARLKIENKNYRVEAVKKHV